MTPVIAPKFIESTTTTKSPINVLIDVLTRQMGLDEGRVSIYNQKFKLPTDDGLVVAVGFMGGKVYRLGSNFLADGTEDQLVNMQELYSIDILSKSEEAMFRKEEVLMALASQYCLQQQELYSMKIARVPSGFNDVSEVEGSARIYRFNITIQVLACYRKNVAVDYYNTFGVQVRVDSNNASANSTQIAWTQSHP